MRDTEISHTVKLLGRAEKATGKHKNWHNLDYPKPASLTSTIRPADL